MLNEIYKNTNINFAKYIKLNNVTMVYFIIVLLPTIKVNQILKTITCCLNIAIVMM